MKCPDLQSVHIFANPLNPHEGRGQLIEKYSCTNLEISINSFKKNNL